MLENSVTQGVNMPKEGSNMQISNYHKQLQTPFVIYADFDSNQKDIQKPNRDNAGASYTDKCQDHIACSYG